ncbi:EAL domain-containing protein [Frankia sp. R82]|uniref:putative bifunctional diguanylate cyclase/phosphodiesterase n=1 Tax=Frankia sp. R82 TaxID=2950553 RepID=UPI00204336AE|nr:EAL domain-containing protein [Frankia sp. R82]MCM3887219.1 EAL domain-containing protein [Frankia sp. R82]
MLLVDATAVAAGLGAALSCGWAGRRLGRPAGYWMRWLSFALSCWTLGQAAWLARRWEQPVDGRRGIAQVGYLADAGHLAMSVLALAALASVPAQRAGRRRGPSWSRSGYLARVRTWLRAQPPASPTATRGTAAPAGGGDGAVGSGGSRLWPVPVGGWGRPGAAVLAGQPATVALDELIVAGSLFLLTWSGLLTGLPVDAAGATRGVDSDLLPVAYPVAILALALTVVHVACYRRPADRPAVVTAGAGLLVLALAGLGCARTTSAALSVPGLAAEGTGRRTGAWWTSPGPAGGVLVLGTTAVLGALLVMAAALRVGRPGGSDDAFRGAAVPVDAVPGGAVRGDAVRGDAAQRDTGQGEPGQGDGGRGDAEQARVAWVRLAVPYLAAAAVAALVLGRSRTGNVLDPVEGVVVAILVAAVVVRQMLTARTNERLISVLVEAEREVRHWISHDPLTELASRELFRERLTTALATSRRDGSDVAVVYCDLDDFRVINDSLGHAAGDHLLRAVGQRLRHCVRTADTVARLGSDEFAVLLDGGRELPEQVAERILTALRQPVAVGGHQWPVHASVGLVVAGRTQETTEVLLRRAAMALHAAKQTGRNRLVVYRPGLGMTPQAQLVAGTHLADALATALCRGGWSAGFAVHYQPIVRLCDHRPVALEALARWTAPGRGPVPPGTFVAAAENSGIVGTLDDMIMGLACSEIALAFPDSSLRLHVNVSASRVADMTLLDSVVRALASSRFDPARLVVEITETSRLTDLRGAREVLDEVRALGVAVALDDVGAGHSTLAALHLLPVDVVKLDRTLVEAPRDGGRVAALRRSMISLAHALGAVVVAEGIEREAQLAELTELGCELGQGYLFARPGPLPIALVGRGDLPPAVDCPAVDCPAVDYPAADCPAVDGPTPGGRTAGGPTVDGPTVDDATG